MLTWTADGWKFVRHEDYEVPFRELDNLAAIAPDDPLMQEKLLELEPRADALAAQ